jgi:SAM domain (Sterile alpha motif)
MARRKSEKSDDNKNLTPSGATAPIKRGPGRPPGPSKSNEAMKGNAAAEPPEKRAKTDHIPPPTAVSNGLGNGYPQAGQPQQQQLQQHHQLPPPQQQQLPLTAPLPAAPPPQSTTAPPLPSPQQQRPNPLKWNVGEVCDFIKALPGCSEYVEEFAAQEIDGQALMLLKADHLMSAMSIKLGPALKICSHIEQIREELNRN